MEMTVSKFIRLQRGSLQTPAFTDCEFFLDPSPPLEPAVSVSGMPHMTQSRPPSRAPVPEAMIPCRAACWDRVGTATLPPLPALQAGPAGRSLWGLRCPPGVPVRVHRRVRVPQWTETWSWPSPDGPRRGRAATWPGARPHASGRAGAGTSGTSRPRRHR